MTTQEGVRLCVCGCGAPVKDRYAQGHDTRVKGWFTKVKNGKMTQAELAATGIISAAYAQCVIHEAALEEHRRKAAERERELVESLTARREFWERCARAAGDGDR